MSAVVILAVAADPYLAAAEAHARACGWYADDSLLTAGQAAHLVALRAQEPAFKAAVDAALAVERRTVRRLERENGRLRGRIVGAIAVLRNAHDTRKPGMAAVAVSNALLALECSADDADLEACIARHPAGRKLTDH